MGYTADPYQFFKPDAPGDVYPQAEHAHLVDSLGEFLTQVMELVGLSGIFSATDFNGTVVPGELALQISGGRAIIGEAGDRKLVYKSASSTVEDGVNGVTLTPSATNYFFLLQDGTWEVNTTGTPPAGSELVISAVFDADEATSIDDDPAGRSNLGALLTSLQALADAEPGALTIGGAGAVGSSEQAAREDHTHDMPAAAAPVATGAANSEGVAATLARSDHVHAMGSSSADGVTLEVNAGALRIKDSGVSANKLATDAVTTTKILNAAVTAAKLADAVQDAIGGTSNLTAGAEATNARQVTVQLRDLAGNNLAERRLVRIWIGDSDFGGEAAAAPDGGITVTTGTLIQTVTAGKQLLILSNSSGVVQVTLTESTVKTFYVMASVADRVASVAVAFV